MIRNVATPMSNVSDNGMFECALVGAGRCRNVRCMKTLYVGV